MHSYWLTADKTTAGCWKIAMVRRYDVRSRIRKTDPDSLALMNLIYGRVKELG